MIIQPNARTHTRTNTSFKSGSEKYKRSYLTIVCADTVLPIASHSHGNRFIVLRMYVNWTDRLAHLCLSLFLTIRFSCIRMWVTLFYEEIVKCTTSMWVCMYCVLLIMCSMCYLFARSHSFRSVKTYAQHHLFCVCFIPFQFNYLFL